MRYATTWRGVYALAIIIHYCYATAGRDRVYVGIMRTWDNWRAIVVGKTIDRSVSTAARYDHSSWHSIASLSFFSESRDDRERHGNLSNLSRSMFFFGNTCSQIFKAHPPPDDRRSLKRGFSKTPFCVVYVIIYAHIETRSFSLCRRINIEILIFEPFECSKIVIPLVDVTFCKAHGSHLSPRVIRAWDLESYGIL